MGERPVKSRIVGVLVLLDLTVTIVWLAIMIGLLPPTARLRPLSRRWTLLPFPGHGQPFPMEGFLKEHSRLEA